VNICSFLALNPYEEKYDESSTDIQIRHGYMPQNCYFINYINEARPKRYIYIYVYICMFGLGVYTCTTDMYIPFLND
jgi:hypothetical protein